MIHGIVQIFGPIGVAPWGGATTRAAFAASFTTLDTTAETVDDARYNRQEDNGTDDNPDDNRPPTELAQHQRIFPNHVLAIRLRHTFIPTRERLRSRLDFVDSVSRP